MSTFHDASGDVREHYFTCRANCDWAEDYSKEPFAEGDACLAGHTDHDCTCDEIAQARAENHAEAYADTVDRYGVWS